MGAQEGLICHTATACLDSAAVMNKQDNNSPAPPAVLVPSDTIPFGQAALETPQASMALTSERLMGGRKVIHIEHNGATYQLRATKLGKLILTK